MEQFRLAREETACLSLARRLVHGKIRNQRTLLMRSHAEPPEAIIPKLKRASEDALTAGSIEELHGIEGAAASQYCRQFGGMVKVDKDLPGLGLSGDTSKQRKFNFNFSNRNRRPPTDNVQDRVWDEGIYNGLIGTAAVDRMVDDRIMGEQPDPEHPMESKALLRSSRVTDGC